MLDTGDTSSSWLISCFGDLTDSVEFMSPSEWSEKFRYLPASVTPIPGFYSYDVAPYLVEIVDCFDFRSPVREVSVMKGAQICWTTGVLENVIGYGMHQLKTSPMMLLTADAELAKMRMETYITPMIQQSDLEHLIRSGDETNSRKTGKTDSKIEWMGGGFLVPFGARNAAKLRSISIQYLLEDENDGYPDTVGRDGDPAKLAEGRTKAYHQTRKIGRGSTPLIKGQSRIARNFKDGDQRYYNVVCRNCEEPQVLKFQGRNDNGSEYGLRWTIEDGRLLIDSVRYRCRYCGHDHVNADKVWMFDPANGAKWIPTSVPVSDDVRSYHISALYSPAGMYPWSAVVQSYLNAWDVETNRPKDLGLFQEFYNNDLGEVFEIRGDKLQFNTVSSHRRNAYQFGEIPNEFSMKYCGSPILLLTCAVDVHKSNLAVSVMGWTRGSRCFVIDYWRFEGDCEDIDNADTWGRLRDLIENGEWTADDGKKYLLETTFIDSGFSTDIVNLFCSEFGEYVTPIKGVGMPGKTAMIKEFDLSTNKLGRRSVNVTVDLYKDRWSAGLRRQWNGQAAQPAHYFNAPLDMTDKQLKELTVEHKREKVEASTGKRVGFEWHRPGNARNELWDLLMYNNAALEYVAWVYCTDVLELDHLNMVAFYDMIEDEAYYYTQEEVNDV